jgi:hypothetical protein
VTVWADIAQRVRHVSREETRNVSPPVQRFQVTRVLPLRLEEVAGSEVLEEGDPDVEIGQALKLKDLEGNRVVAVGDLVAVHQDEHKDWIASDVVRRDAADDGSDPDGDVISQALRGPQGDPGPKGDIGEQGPQGEPGAQGDPGTPALPIGAPIPWLVATVPAGFVALDGSAIDSGTYPVLAALYGANLPDLRDQFLMGASATHAIGTTGGEAAHVLTNAEMGIPATAASGVGANTGTPYGLVAATAHNNLPPFRAVYWICPAG